MKKIAFIIMIVFMSLGMTAQSYHKYEGVTNDYYNQVWNVIETSDNNVIMIEHCHEVIDNQHLEEAGINIIKLNNKGEFVESKFVEFMALNYSQLLYVNPLEDNNNVYAGFYEKDGMCRYNAIFFDNDLKITKEVDVEFSADNFDLDSYSHIIDNNNDIVIAYYYDKNINFVKMDVNGNIKSTKTVEQSSYSDLHSVAYPLYVHSVDPLQYGYVCTSPANQNLLVTIVDEDFEKIAVKDIGEIDSYILLDLPINGKILRLNDGNIIIPSIVHKGEDKYIQISKLDKDFNHIVSKRFAHKDILDDKHYFNYHPMSVLQADNGGIYMAWYEKDEETKVSVSYMECYDEDLNTLWSVPFYETTEILYFTDVDVLEDGGFVIAGSIPSDNAELQSALAFIFQNRANMSVNESSMQKPYYIKTNPAKDVVRLDYSGNIKAQKVEIYSVDGKLRIEENDNLGDIDVNVLSNGIYIMKVYFDNGLSFTDKIIKL